MSIDHKIVGKLSIGSHDTGTIEKNKNIIEAVISELEADLDSIRALNDANKRCCKHKDGDNLISNVPFCKTCGKCRVGTH